LNTHLHGNKDTKDTMGMMILPDNIEISPSNRARCDKCGKFIGKGEPRLVTSFAIRSPKTIGGSVLSKDYRCYRCSEETLNGHIEALKSNIIRFQNMKKKIKQELSKEGMDKLLLANELNLGGKDK
jgi:hypothetical protein